MGNKIQQNLKNIQPRVSSSTTTGPHQCLDAAVRGKSSHPSCLALRASQRGLSQSWQLITGNHRHRGSCYHSRPHRHQSHLLFLSFLCLGCGGKKREDGLWFRRLQLPPPGCTQSLMNTSAFCRPAGLGLCIDWSPPDFPMTSCEILNRTSVSQHVRQATVLNRPSAAHYPPGS